MRRLEDQGRIWTGDEISKDTELTPDVCVVGSGSGGAWVAHELAARGKSVVVLEDGGYFTRRDFDLTEFKAYSNLYQEKAARATADLSIIILQGRSVGGGTTVNWTTSFRTPERVLAAWRDRFGLDEMKAEVLGPHWDAIEKRLHIAEWPLERMNANNRVLYDGCEKLGLSRGIIKRNVNGCANLGYCGTGCPLDAKQSMLATILPDAVELGASIYANCFVRQLEVEGRRVKAVHAEIRDPATDKPKGVKLTVRPKVCVVSAGALNSPSLLLRSGLDGRKNVGKRTYLHPAIVTVADFEQEVKPFAGAPQSAYSHHFYDRGKDKVGFLLEAAPLQPLIAATYMPGFGASHQELLSRLPHLNALTAICVDGLMEGDEGGTVTLRDGGDPRPKLTYPISPALWEALRFGAKTTARIQLAAGATRVYSMHDPPVVVSKDAEIDAAFDGAQWAPLRVRVGTAHQMGGCTMGKDPARSVVDPHLRYHDLDNLFVADGSVFPTALGVNPQETIFGIARWGSQHVASALGA